ncbi:hypothetical protein VCR17J2_680064 [Vibrio coralliirubri]|nr:hypothetical protein VCR17J2_680064 [Vibrio coralliirubri]
MCGRFYILAYRLYVDKELLIEIREENEQVHSRQSIDGVPR